MKSCGFASLAEDEQWAIQLPWLWPFERIHLFIEAVVCEQRNSVICASVGKHRRYLFVSEVEPHVFRVFQYNAEAHIVFMSDYRFGPAGDPRGAGIGTPEAIKLVWSCHREIIQDIGPILNSWKTPPCS